MFGILRYLLALMVVQTHLWKAAPWAGNYAVFTFFVLSGYLMTLVLHERYSFGPAGVMRFLANRALRIYPPYWIVLPLAAYAAYHAPHLASAVHRHYALPATDVLWLKNILIIGADHPTKSTLVIPAWSLHIELVFYGLMALGLSRNRATVFLWFAAGLAYTVYMAMLHPTEYQFWYYRYFPLQAGSLAFSAGAAVYYLRGRVSLPPGIAFAVTAFAAAFMSGAGVIWSDADALYLQGFIFRCPRLPGGACPCRRRRILSAGCFVPSTGCSEIFRIRSFVPCPGRGARTVGPRRRGVSEYRPLFHHLACRIASVCLGAPRRGRETARPPA